MNQQQFVLSRQDIEEYIYSKLKETYWKFRGKIVPSTTFRELERHDDPELIGPDLLMDIEEDLGVYLPDEAVEALDDKDICVGTLINTVAKYSPTAAGETTPFIEEIPRNPRSVAERIVRWFIERSRPQENEKAQRKTKW